MDTTPTLMGWRFFVHALAISARIWYTCGKRICYSPELRRFINADVIAGDISDAVTLNRFAYVNGNPVSFVDPWGLRAVAQKPDVQLPQTIQDEYDPEIVSVQLPQRIQDEYNLKIVSSAVVYLRNNLKNNRRNYTERFFNSFANALEFEGAVGVGIGVQTSGGSLGVNKSIVGGVDDGKEYAGHKVSVELDPGVGFSYDAFHQSESDYKPVRCDSDHVYERKTIFNILACKETQHSAELIFGPISVNNEGEVCLKLFSVGAYVGIGATIDLTLNLTELWEGMNP